LFQQRHDFQLEAFGSQALPEPTDKFYFYFAVLPRPIAGFMGWGPDREGERKKSPFCKRLPPLVISY